MYHIGYKKHGFVYLSTFSGIDFTFLYTLSGKFCPLYTTKMHYSGKNFASESLVKSRNLKKC